MSLFELLQRIGMGQGETLVPVHERELQEETWVLPGMCGLPQIVRAFVPKEG